ncbi:NAD(P)/FAD-dependent oxidoreductase [Streptomyces sp. NPDC058534]|uniref:NAD(P)/FAD-dependent oxidoreductase n=1 Tax=Streptomyces sp. NPDC058534 TaxID=3346541 RepID=UPI003646A50C
MSRHIVVVGTGAAGLTVAEELRHLGYDGALTLVGGENHPPYDRPPLSKRFLAGEAEAAQLWLAGPDVLDRLDATAYRGRRAVAADLAARTVTLDGGTVLPYSDLVVATGVTPRTLPGTAGLTGALTLKTLDDARALGARLLPGQRLVVVGGGFLGTETAWTALALGCGVTLVTPTTTVLPGLGDRVGSLAGERLAAAGATVLTQVAVHSVREGDGLPRGGDLDVLLDDGTRLPAETVLVAIGSRPDTGWLSVTNLDLSDGIRCDATGRAAPRVHACGDVAAWYQPSSGRHLRLEHRMHASDQARVVAADLLGEHRELDRAPFFWTDQGPNKIVVHGLITPDAEFDAHEADTEHDRFTGVYRTDGRVCAVLGWNNPRQAMRLRRELLTDPAPAPVGAPLAAATSAG